MIGVKLTPIVPPEFQAGELRRALQAEANAVRYELFLDFKATTATWNKQPKFNRPRVSLSDNIITMEVTTDDKIYGILDAGRGAVTITTEKKAFKLSMSYVAKTAPGVIGSGAGGEQGVNFIAGPTVVAGPIAPRRFQDTIQKKWDTKLAPRFQKALDQAAARTGHGMGAK